MLFIPFITKQALPANGRFILRVNISRYENPQHKLESGVCCSDCPGPCPIGCSVNCTCGSCDNYLVFAVYEGGCSDLGGCDQWGRFEYYYGDDDSTNSRDPVTIFGQGNCPVEVIDAFNYTPIDYLLQVNKQTRSILLLTLGAHARGLQYLSCLCVCLSVCFPYSGTSRNQAYKQQYQRLQRDTGMKYKKGFFFKTLRSEVMASFTHLE